MDRSLRQEGRPLLFDHWRPIDESGIESDRTIFAGEGSPPSVPDESRGHARSFVRRDRGRPAFLCSNPSPCRIQLDQLAAQLACTTAQVIYAGEDLTAASKARRQIRNSVSRAPNKRVGLVSFDSSALFTGKPEVIRARSRLRGDRR